MKLIINTRAVLIAFLTFFSLSATAQQAPSETYTQHKEVFHSKVLGEERTVTVQLPKSYLSSPDKVYPVIYRLDGADNIALITAVLEQLQQANAAPEAIIVAIENTDRLRDLYPTANQDPRGPVGLGGGAGKFLDFIERELIPLVDKEYRTHDFKVISGGSAGGAFSLYALQAKPDLFQAHLAYSPAVWWNYGNLAKSTKAFFAKAKDVNGYVYMDIGEEGGFMRDVYDDLNQFMQANKPKNLTLVSDVFDGVPHGLTAAAGIFNAYHNLFLPQRMPNQAFTGEMDSITGYYARLSTQYGETISAPEWVVREIGYHYVRQNDFDTAIKLFKFDIELYPNSADAYNGLAYGYESSGQYKESLKQVDMALSLSKEGDDGYDVYVSRRDRLTALINGNNL